MARRAPLFSPVAQLSGSAFGGKRTTPPFCRSSCRFPQTPSCSKALVPVALRAPHPLPHAPRLRGEWGWERPPSILRMDGPQTGGFCRTSCRLSGSLPARASGASDPCGKAAPGRWRHPRSGPRGVPRGPGPRASSSPSPRPSARSTSRSDTARSPGLPSSPSLLGRASAS